MILGGAPQQLLATNLAQFLEQIPLLRDGDERAIHEARVALRRLREPLALITAGHDHDHLQAFDARLNKVFKALGRTRDADIAQRLVHHVETRFPLVPAAVGHLRATIARDQLAERRILIKTLESTEAHALGDVFDAARQRERWRFLPHSPWRAHLAKHVQERGVELLRALDHAAGVYFRNRSHAARVAIKQFRYALELARALGAGSITEDFRSLRKAQNALGEAHDRDVLMRRIADLTGDNEVVPKQELTLLEQFLAAEINDHHQKYMVMRPVILELCAVSLRPRRHLPVRAGAMAVAALAIGTAIRRRHA